MALAALEGPGETNKRSITVCFCSVHSFIQRNPKSHGVISISRSTAGVALLSFDPVQSWATLKQKHSRVIIRRRCCI